MREVKRKKINEQNRKNAFISTWPDNEGTNYGKSEVVMALNWQQVQDVQEVYIQRVPIVKQLTFPHRVKISLYETWMIINHLQNVPPISTFVSHFEPV